MLTPQVRAYAATRGFDADLLALPIRLAEEAEEFPALGRAANGRVRIYLDTKDWINLGRARLGQPEGQRYAALYEALRAYAASGEILVPLCATTYMEVMKNPNPKQRSDLTAVVSEISGFATLTGSSFAVADQVRASIANLVGSQASRSIDPFGFGVSYALGDRRVLVVRQRDGRVADMSDPELRGILTAGRALAEFELLLSPRPEDMASLRANGYRPERAYEVHVRRLAREQELAAHLVANPSDRTRLKDFVAARYLYWELQDYVAEIAPEFGITSTEFYRQGKEWLTAFVTGVSSAAVHMALTEANFRNRDKAWKGNDIYDADAMASAVPYCDVVMTDAHVARQIADAEAVRRHGTLVFSKPDELLRSLPDLVAARMASTESNASLG